LDIKPKQRPTQKPTIDLLTTIAFNSREPTTTNINIADIYYGTLITGPAMKNIQRINSIVANDHEFGIIAHHLMNYAFKTSFSLNIDSEKKKLSIIGNFDVSETLFSDISGTLKFEWNFQE
jgi:hypothetical protein